MSISLDIALFLRDHGKEYDSLILADRAVLFTLAFRLGSNSSSWVSQEELSHELNISERGLRKNLSRLCNLGLILINKSKLDMRKNVYRCADFLVNYHQERKKYRNGSSSNSGNTSENNRHSGSCNFQDTGTVVPVLFTDTGTVVPVSNDENHTQPIDSTKQFSPKNPTIVTYKSKVKQKAKRHIRAREEHAPKTRTSGAVCVSDSLHETEKQELQNVSPIPEQPTEENLSTREKWMKEQSDTLEQRIADMKNGFPWKELIQFNEHRASLGCELSDFEGMKVINQIIIWEAEGINTKRTIQNSIANGWKNLYVNKFKENINGLHKTAGQHNDVAARKVHQECAPKYRDYTGCAEFDKGIREFTASIRVPTDTQYSVPNRRG